MSTQGRLLYGHLHQFPGCKDEFTIQHLTLWPIQNGSTTVTMTIKYFWKVSILWAFTTLDGNFLPLFSRTSRDLPI